jgi:hypothetical protein
MAEISLDRTTMSTNHVKGGIASFTGHMVDAPGRENPPFPAGKIESVRREIAKALLTHDLRHGFSSAARGSDILFVEELLRRGGIPHVFLPFPANAFARTSVGYGWDDRYWQVLRDPQVKLVEMASSLPAEGDLSAAYDRCNVMLQQEAIRLATSIGIKPILLAVWNGNPGDGRGGTADAVRGWIQQGYHAITIDLSKL